MTVRKRVFDCNRCHAQWEEDNVDPDATPEMVATGGWIPSVAEERLDRVVGRLTDYLCAECRTAFRWWWNNPWNHANPCYQQGPPERKSQMKERAMRKVHWTVKQLLPLRYTTGYVRCNAGEPKVAVYHTWRMWFGRCFRQSITELGEVI